MTDFTWDEKFSIPLLKLRAGGWWWCTYNLASNIVNVNTKCNGTLAKE